MLLTAKLFTVLFVARTKSSLIGWEANSQFFSLANRESTNHGNKYTATTTPAQPRTRAKNTANPMNLFILLFYRRTAGRTFGSLAIRFRFLVITTGFVADFGLKTILDLIKRKGGTIIWLSLRCTGSKKTTELQNRQFN